MKKVKVEVQSTLTYTPFENIGELIKDAPKKEVQNGDDKHSASSR